MWCFKVSGNIKDYVMPVPEKKKILLIFLWYEKGKTNEKKRIEKVENFFKSRVEKLERTCI